MSLAAAAWANSSCDGPRSTSASREPPHSAASKPLQATSAALARPSSPPTQPGPADAAHPAPLGAHWLSQLPKQTRQVVLVTSADWGASVGELQRYAVNDSVWQDVGTSVSVVLGKRGLGWGSGLHRPEGDGPTKREGDGKAPAGLFLLNRSYGHGPGASLHTSLQHTPVTSSWRCVDDVASKHYGELLDGSVVRRDWSSAEKLVRDDPLYEILVLVEHNPQRQRAAGSCIFLHTWRFSKERPEAPRPTVGCTAMARTALRQLAEWLEPGAVLAQLPRPQVLRP